MIKKVRTLILLMIIIFSISLNVEANELKMNTGLMYHQEVNSLYKNENIDNDFVRNIKSSKLKTSQQFNIDNYVEEQNILAATARDYMVNRENEFTLYGKLTLDKVLDQSTFDNYIATLLKIAMSEELSNSSSAGDYLKWSWNTYNVTANFAYQNIGSKYIYYMNLYFDFKYYTTKEQEDVLNNHIKEYVEENINLVTDTVYDKVKKIYSFITKNVRYDYKNLNDNTYTLKYTAYAAMENKTAVCQGYAALFYKMAKESAIDEVRMITSSNHAWNIVRIGIFYYNLDSTFDEGLAMPQFFLKGSDNFKEVDHIRSAEYCTQEFKKEYPTSHKDYDPNNTKLNIGEGSIKYTNSYTYDGDSKKPGVTITYGEYKLEKDKDYTVSYKDNKYPGTGKIIIQGIGEFEGKVEKSFSIKLVKASGFNVSKNYTNKVALKWSKKSDVTGYKLYKYNSKKKKYECVKTLNQKTTSYTISNLSVGSSYKFKIRTYLTKSGKTYYGDYTSELATATLPSKVTIYYPSAGSKKMTVKWRKVSAGTGYEIKYSTSSSFKSSKTETTRIEGKSKTSKTISKLKKGTKYYIKVRAYKTVNGKRYYGSYSSVRTVRVR